MAANPIPSKLVVLLFLAGNAMSNSARTNATPIVNGTSDSNITVGHDETRQTVTLPMMTKASTPSPPQPSVTKETYERVFAIMNMFNMIYEAVSVVLTFISACVYALPKMRCATAWYLVALNGADTLSGFLVVLRAVWGAVKTPPVAELDASYHYMSIYGNLLVTVSCRRLVYSLSAMVSLERFFVIAFPMKARYIKLVKYPRMSIALVTVAIFAMHVYLPLQFDVVPSSRGVGYWIIRSESYKANPGLYDDVSNAAKTMFAYIPLCLCLVLSVALMVALQRHAASRQALQEGKDDAKAAETRNAERQLAMTIWLSTLLYTLLSLPTNTVQVVATHHSTFCFGCLEGRLYNLVGRFVYVALITSRYTNFFSYLGMSTAFRRNLIGLLCPRKLEQRLLGGSGNSGTDTVSGSSRTLQTSDVSLSE